jgi:hypothetical protein
VRIPENDKVARGEGLGCVVGVKPSEGVARFVAVTLGVTEGNTVWLSIGDPVIEYDELGVRIPEGDGVCELEGVCSGELLAPAERVTCVTVNKGVIDTSDVGLSRDVQLATELSDGLAKGELVAVNSPESVEVCVWVPRTL